MSKVIRIAAALIDDGDGSLFLVRKKGTAAFMQAGGKIEKDEQPLEALARELAEELTLTLPAEPRYLGLRTAEAANEPGRTVQAHLFHIRTSANPFVLGAELEEGVWVNFAGAVRLTLAPLTRRHVLPLARSLCP
jgi:8-oxo-dGTP diphosphatase